MPIFRVQVNYRRGDANKWSNVWHVSATTLPTAADAFRLSGVPDLLPMLHNDCELASLLVSDESTSDFITVPINTNGTSTHVDSMLALFNSVKVLFFDGSFGRPDYKYFKGFLTEATSEDGIVNSDIVTFFETQLGTLQTDMEDALAPLVSKDNDQYQSATCQAQVQMRQMHRKRRKAAVVPTP